MAHRDYGYRDPRYSASRFGPEGIFDWYGGGVGLEPLFGYYRRGPLYASDFGSDYYGGGYGRDVSTYGGAPGPMRRETRRESYVGRGPRGYRRRDERIRDEINERLTRHSGIDASDVEVRVKAGEVTLTGIVEDRREKRLAEDIAEEIFGVNDVHNELRIRHGFLAGLTGEKATEWEVQRATKRA
jgi:hypothetical protein